MIRTIILLKGKIKTKVKKNNKLYSILHIVIEKLNLDLSLEGVKLKKKMNIP